MTRDLTRRPRRLRQNANIRELVRETGLTTDDLIMPVFVTAEEDVRRPIPSMPDIFQYSIGELDRELDQLLEVGVDRILLFGIPHDEDKDAIGSDTFSEDGIVQRALRHVQSQYGDELLVVTDVCFCEYTTHGHCGVVDEEGRLLNDPTLENLQRQVVSHAEAGADVVAPSGMIDGQVGAIREALDEAGFHEVPILSYAVKYASDFYGPFREAVETEDDFDHRRRYQMDPPNGREALVEAELDVDEGADMLMVKPALAYLDVIREVRDRFDVPLACYNVSGEYAMTRAADAKGWIDGREVALEMLTSMKRAGAEAIISYFARSVADALP